MDRFFILTLIDNAIYAQKFRHLNDGEVRILERLIEGKTYEQIADETNYDAGHIGDKCRILFKHLSQHYQTKITKFNFCWELERLSKQITI